MPSWNDPRETALHGVRPALAKLTGRGIELPDTVTTATATLDRIEASRPAEPSHTAIREAILEGADRDELDALVLDELGYTRLAAEHRQAYIDAAVRVMAAIRDGHDEIHPQLAALAHKAIAHLEAVAELPTCDVMQLVRDGDHRGAQLVAEVDTVAAELTALYEIRDEYITRGGPAAMQLGHVNASVWKDPDKPGRGDTPGARYLDGLARGNTLWYPTAPEAVEAARPAYKRANAKAEETAAIRRAQDHAAQAFAR